MLVLSPTGNPQQENRAIVPIPQEPSSPALTDANRNCVTVKRVLTLNPPEVTETVAEPVPTAVTKAVPLSGFSPVTATTPVLSLDHANGGPERVCPAASLITAPSETVPPTTIRWCVGQFVNTSVAAGPNRPALHAPVPFRDEHEKVPPRLSGRAPNNNPENWQVPNVNVMLFRDT
jgi:hypothetical protein